MKSHNFPLADFVNFSTATADDMVAQCLAQGRAEHADAAQYAAGLKSLALGERDVGSAQLYREPHAVDSTSQRIGPSGTAVEEDASQTSVFQKPQASWRRLRDLETQLAELKASNSELKASNSELKASNSELKASNSELKELHKNETDALRAENMELKKSLSAAQPVQKPK
jgi:FtsZ-binding cell division protein ZapB